MKLKSKSKTKLKFILTLILISKIIFVFALTALFASCSLLPAEDEPLPAPVLNQYERIQPTMIAVRRDDLVQTRTISCRCKPIREESYSFRVGGIYIDHVYFSVGDPVKAGDMLAELERKDILVQVEEAENTVRKQEYALELAKDDTALLRDKAHIQAMLGSDGGADLPVDGADLPVDGEKMRQAVIKAYGLAVLPARLEGYVGRYEKAYDDYLFNVSYAEKRLEIAERKLKILLDMADERVIYAGIDGIVSYAQRYTPENRSIAGEKAFTISDASELIFAVSGDDSKYFTPGRTYQMKVSKTTLDMRAVTPEEIGETRAADSEPVVYFIPGELTAGLTTYGYIVVETDRRDDALYLPASAIIQVGNGYAAYRVGESGFRELAPVEIGVTISGKTEILSGLKEGDEVILA